MIVFEMMSFGFYGSNYINMCNNCFIIPNFILSMLTHSFASSDIDPNNVINIGMVF